MDIDLDLYRHEVRVSTNLLAHRAASLVRLSAIDIAPEHPQRHLFLSTAWEGRPNSGNTSCKNFRWRTALTLLNAGKFKLQSMLRLAESLIL